MYINQIYELYMSLDHENFEKVFNRARGHPSDLVKDGEDYTDKSLNTKGLTVVYRNTQYNKKVYVRINFVMIWNGDSNDLCGSIQELDRCIRKYFGYKYKLSDFTLSGLTLSTSVIVGDQAVTAAYLEVLRRIGKVKGFSPISCEYLEDKKYFYLKGNSNGIRFMIYDMRKVLSGESEKGSTDGKKSRTAAKEVSGADRLCLEICLTKPKALKFYTGERNIEKQIIDLSQKHRDIFINILSQIVPYGDYYKKDKAVELIWKNVKNIWLRRRMLQLVELIPGKKSLYLAQKAMNCRKMHKVMLEFAKINVSPVTLGKRQDQRYLKSIYEYL